MGMDRKVLTARINKDCDGKTECNIALTNKELYTEEYLNMYNAGTSIGLQSFNEGHCGDHAAFFIQYPCLIAQKDRDSR